MPTYLVHLVRQEGYEVPVEAADENDAFAKALLERGPNHRNGFVDVDLDRTLDEPVEKVASTP